MEFLVWVVDRGGAEPTNTVGTYYKGEVMIGKPDGWGWSTTELGEDRWRVVRVTSGLTAQQIADFQARGTANVAGHFWKRQYTFNWAALTPASLAAQFVGPTAGTIIPLTGAQVVAIATLKANP